MAPHVALLSVHSSPLATIGTEYAGGMNVYVLELARRLSAAGIEVDVFTRRTDATQPTTVLLAPRVRLFHLDAGPPREVPKPTLQIYVSRMGDEIVRLAQERQVQYDVVHSHYWLSGLVALQIRDALHAPIIHMFHTLSRVKEFYSREASADDPANRAEGETEIIAGADVIVGSTEEELQYMRKLYGIDPARYCVIPPGVDQEHFRPHDRLAARHALQLEGERIVLFVGRPDRIKRFDILLQAVAQFGDTHIVALGDLGNESRVRRTLNLVRHFELEGRVHLRAAVPQAELPLYYSAADVCAIPSMYESFGMVALESMACETPVVAFRVGGLATTIEQGVTGFLANPGCPQSYADALQRALFSPHLGAMGVRARESVQRWSWGEMCNRTISLYCQTIGRPTLLSRRVASS